MVDRDIVMAKISSVQKCLKRIREVSGMNPESLDDINTEEIVTLNLQRAIQSTIDLAAHIVADEGWGVPQELRENFDILLKHGVLSKELTQKLRKMVGFRNIAVHEYQSIDVEILKSILKNDLKDIEEFYSLVFKHFQIAE